MASAQGGGPGGGGVQVGQVHAVGNHANRVAQARGADGPGLGGAQRVQTRGVIEMGALERPGREFFLPAGICQRPGVEHPMGRDEVGSPGPPPPGPHRDRRITPQAVGVQEVGVQPAQVAVHRGRNPHAGQTPGRENAHVQRRPGGQVFRGKTVRQREHLHRDGSFGGEGRAQSAHALEKAPGPPGNRQGNERGFHGVRNRASARNNVRSSQ